uniref:Uncharacterized protein n=1 Tax=Cucumis melo TaxID=3656 RepID=A0A9I9E6Q6_CUCME
RNPSKLPPPPSANHRRQASVTDQPEPVAELIDTHPSSSHHVRISAAPPSRSCGAPSSSPSSQLLSHSRAASPLVPSESNATRDRSQPEQPREDRSASRRRRSNASSRSAPPPDSSVQPPRARVHPQAASRTLASRARAHTRPRPSSRADSQSSRVSLLPSSRVDPYSSSRAAKPLLEPPSLFRNILDQLTLERWISSIRAQALQPRPRLIGVVLASVSFGITTYLGLRSPTGPPVWHGYRYDSIDSTGSSQPDCLSVSSGFGTDQYVEAGVKTRASWRETRSDRGEPKEFLLPLYTPFKLLIDLLDRSTMSCPALNVTPCDHMMVCRLDFHYVSLGEMTSSALWLIGFSLTNLDIALAFLSSQAIYTKEQCTYQLAP